MKIFARRLWLLAFAGVLSACHLPSSSQKDAAGGASFSIASQDASFTQVASQNSFAIPTSKTMSVKFCVVDVQYNRVVGNHKFIISSENNDNVADQEVTTDGTGCAVWQEDLAYNHLAGPAFVELVRTVTAKGYQKGERPISLAVDPWEDKIVSLKDSRVANLTPKEQAQTRLQGLDSTTGKAADRPLWLQNATVTFTPRNLGGKTTYNVELQADPKLILKDINGQNVFTTLKQGQFTAQLKLISEPLTGASKSNRSVVAKPAAVSVDSLISSQVVVSTNMDLPGSLSLNQYYLSVELSPVNGPKGVQNFKGIYQLGFASVISGSQTPKLLNDGDLKGNGGQQFSVENFIGNSPITPQSVKTSAEATDSSSEMQNSSIRIGAVSTDSHTFTPKSGYLMHRKFNLTVCFAGALDLSRQPVQITGIGGQTLKATTVVSNCATAEDSIDYNYFAPECLTKREIRVQSDALGINQKIPVEVDVATLTGTFLKVLPTIAHLSDHKDNQCASGQSKIIASTSSYTLDKVDITYSIDELLNLQIHKSEQLKLTLSVDRPSLTSDTGVENKPLPQGTYTLRWAVVDMIVKDYSKASGYIYAVGEKDVTILSNSTIAETISLDLTNIKSVGNTNYLLLEIVPKGEDPKNLPSGMAHNTLRALITIANNVEGSSVTTTEHNSIIPGLIEQYRKDQLTALQASKAMGTKERFASDHHLKLLNLHAGDALTADTGDLNMKVGTLIARQKFASDQEMQLLSMTAKSTLTIDRKLVHDWVTTGKMTPDLRANLCLLWVSNVLAKPLRSGKPSPFKNSNFSGYELMQMLGDCNGTDDPRHFFDIEFHEMTERASMVKDLGAYNRNLSIYLSFNLSNNYSVTDTNSISASVGGGFEYGNIVGVTGGASYSFSTSMANSQSWGNSVNVGNGIEASLETIPLRLRAEDYERCAVIKLNANAVFPLTDEAYKNGKGFTSGIKNFYHQHMDENTIQYTASDLTLAEKQEISSRGYMICTGEKAGHPVTFDENYYVINQRGLPPQATNPNSDHERPFFMALRGRADLVSFVSYVQNAHGGVPKEYTNEYQQSQLLYDPTLSVFGRGFRSYPGQWVKPPAN